MINILIREFNFEVVNLCITRTYCTQLYINSVISLVRVLVVMQLLMNTVLLRTKPQLMYLFGNQQAFNSFIKIKNQLWLKLLANK